MTSTPHHNIPAEVTFETGARLLMELGVLENIKADAIRYISRTHPKWPFGEGRPHPYSRISNARTMNADVFLRFFREEYRPTGRGPDQKPRPRKTGGVS